MSEYTKSASAGDADAPKKAKTISHLTTDAPDLTGLGFHLLTEVEHETAREFIRLAMVFDALDKMIRFDAASSSSEHRIICLECRMARYSFRLLVCGWVPTPRLSVVDVAGAFDSIYNGDPDTDATANTLADRREAKSLLTDWTQCREIVSDIRRETAERCAICERFTDALEKLTNWRGCVPRSALIYMTAPVPLEEAEG